MAFIGAELVSVKPGACAIRLPFRTELAQQNGFFHGGIVGTLADNAGGFAAYALMPSDSGVLTVEYKLNHGASQRRSIDRGGRGGAGGPESGGIARRGSR